MSGVGAMSGAAAAGSVLKTGVDDSGSGLEAGSGGVSGVVIGAILGNALFGVPPRVRDAVSATGGIAGSRGISGLEREAGAAATRWEIERASSERRTAARRDNTSAMVEEPSRVPVPASASGSKRAGAADPLRASRELVSEAGFLFVTLMASYGFGSEWLQEIRNPASG